MLELPIARRHDLAALERRLMRDLEAIEYPPRAWMPLRYGDDGAPLHDVVIVGAGLSGLSAAFGLMRKRVSNILVLDGAPAGQEGPWITHARMDVLRSPKTLSGLDLGVPSLTYRAWHEATYGEAAWPMLDRIDRRDWMAYLGWFRAVLALPVQNDSQVASIEDRRDDIVLHLAGGRRVTARRIVLATGIDGSGVPHVPDSIAALPRHLWSHSADMIAPAASPGRRIAVLGAGASAFDAAVHALRSGAARMRLFARRETLPVTEILAWSNFPGFLMTFADLPDADRWRFMRAMRAHALPPTQDIFDEAMRDPRFELSLGTMPQVTADHDALVVTARGQPETFDKLISGTGFRIDLAQRGELAPIHARLALWRDRFTPSPDEADEALGVHPYLGPGFQLLPHQSADPGGLSRIHLFNTGAVPSLGPVCNGVTGLKYGLPRLVDAIVRELFLEDRDHHFASLKAYADPMFDASPARLAHLRARTARPDRHARAAARAACDALIAQTRLRSAEFPDVLANHLPMVLEALCRLGAPAGRLEEYAAHYTRLNAVPLLGPATTKLDASTWTKALGQRDREADQRLFFTQEVRRLGGSCAIRHYVPQLARGVGASALHALMRLAYGVMRNDEAEIGTALGYWAATFLPLPQPDGAASAAVLDPLEIALAMREIPAVRTIDIGGHLLWKWIEAVGNRPDVWPLAGSLRLDGGTLERVRQVSLALYAGTGSFEALHALTGSHWVRIVGCHLDDPNVLVRPFWQAILALYPKMGCPLPPEPVALELMRQMPVDMAAVTAAAIASDDEHDHSLVFSATQEFAHTGDALYLALAARRMGLAA